MPAAPSLCERVNAGMGLRHGRKLAFSKKDGYEMQFRKRRRIGPDRTGPSRALTSGSSRGKCVTVYA